MKKYVVTIEETISQEFDVMANNSEQAIAIAIEKYNLGELVLKTAFVNAVGVAIIYSKILLIQNRKGHL